MRYRSAIHAGTAHGLFLPAGSPMRGLWLARTQPNPQVCIFFGRRARRVVGWNKLCAVPANALSIGDSCRNGARLVPAYFDPHLLLIA
tara:strand:- start:253585 stop:253848 length:264 start_codon:yes stop_codon:yes gene_type:complete